VSPPTARVRRPAVAGLFYPDDPALLATDVRRHLQAPPPRPLPKVGDCRAVVVPHAGYVYSGPVAGVAYRLLAALAARIERVLLLGPPHRVPVWGLQVSAADVWSTPVGDMPVDDAGRRALLAAAAARGLGDLVEVSEAAHGPEHSLEVQVPFLLATLPDVPVLPVLVGEGDTGDMADCLTDWWAEASLVVVSTDLSHYEPVGSAQQHDARTAAAILAADAARIGDHDACGSRALRVMLTLARRAGASVLELDRRTSADTAGTPDRVVGYGAYLVV
jgi:AmmeMemoRadiSam system protein B